MLGIRWHVSLVSEHVMTGAELVMIAITHCANLCLKEGVSCILAPLQIANWFELVFFFNQKACNCSSNLAILSGSGISLINKKYNTALFNLLCVTI